MKNIKKNIRSKPKNFNVVVSKRHFHKMFDIIKSGGKSKTKSKPKKKSKSKPKKKSKLNL